MLYAVQLFCKWTNDKVFQYFRVRCVHQNYGARWVSSALSHVLHLFWLTFPLTLYSRTLLMRKVKVSVTQRLIDEVKICNSGPRWINTHVAKLVKKEKAPNFFFRISTQCIKLMPKWSVYQIICPHCKSSYVGQIIKYLQ